MLELPHPADVWGGCYLDPEQFIDAWDAQSPDGGTTVLVEWGREGDEFDLQRQVRSRRGFMLVAYCSVMAGKRGHRLGGHYR